jgi:hypothetical protein
MLVPIQGHMRTLKEEVRAAERPARAQPRYPHVLCINLRSAGDILDNLHTSAYVSIRQHTSAYVSIRQHTSAYVSNGSTRQHTSAPLSCSHALHQSWQQRRHP